MSPRRRSVARRDLPPNTYCRRGYYSWRDPRTREEYGLGRNKQRACIQAVEANLHIANLAKDKPRLIDRLTGDHDRSVAAWAKVYAEKLAEQAFADNTRRTYASHGRRVVELLGASTPVKSVTALDVSNALKTLTESGKARTAQAVRHFMRDWFRAAIVDGWRDDNPVRDTKLAAPVKVKRARLTLEVFLQARERIELPWLRNAVDLALISGQRREDISAAKFSAFRDGGWWCAQSSEKSDVPHQIFIPLDLRLDVLGMSLGDVLAQCRKSGVLSPYLIHQTEPRGNSPVGSRIWLDTISKRFSAVIAALGIEWGENTPPTFHELRSLSERLYAAQGGVSTQHLLGHNDAETTALYHNLRKSQWVHALDGRVIVRK